MVHAVPGRLRLRVSRVKTDAACANGVVAALAEPPGITGVHVVRACASVVVAYDPRRISPGAVAQAVAGAPPRAATAVATTPTDRAPGSPKSSTAQRPDLWSLVLGGVGVALSLTGAPAAIAVACVAVSAVPILLRAGRRLAARHLSVDALDATAVTLLLARGSLAAAALSTFLIAGGETVRALTSRRARRALVDLFGSAKQLAWVVHGERKERLPADAITAGETVVVYPGELVLVDGVVIRGEASVDQKTLTGESKPVRKRVGDPVYASTLLTDGKLYVRTERAGAQTRANRVLQILEGAPVHETAIANYAGRFADRFVLPTLLLSAALYALTRDAARAVSVLLFDFATGVRVAVPTTVLSAMAAAVRRDVLIKGGRALEQLARVDTILFDKTGTITSGTPRVIDVQALSPEVTTDEVLALAAAAELRLTHPAAQAIVAAAKERGLAIPERGESQYAIGRGIQAEVAGRTILVGSRGLFEERGIALDSAAVASAREAGTEGATTVFVARDRAAIGAIRHRDVPRAEATALMAALRARGLDRLVMVTGDDAQVARAVAREVGIDEVVAEVFPERKAEIVRELQAQGRTVAVIGDGINDSPALSYADVSLSLKEGSDVARETADVVLHGGLGGLVDAIDLARETMRIIDQDLAIVGVPNAAGLLFAAAGALGPTVATAVNNGSSVAAALNGLRPLTYRGVDDRRREGDARRLAG